MTPLSRIRDIDTRFRSWKAGSSLLQRCSLWAAGFALAIFLLLGLSHLVLSLNPYQPLYSYMSQLIESQPDLEERLDYAALANRTLKDGMDITSARGLADWFDNTTEMQIINLAAEYGEKSQTVQKSIRLTSTLAHEIWRVQNGLTINKNSPYLIEQIRAIRSQPNQISPQQLISILDGAPDMIEWIVSLRSQLRTLDDEVRQVTEDPFVGETIESLKSASLPAGDNAEAIHWMTTGFDSWKSLSQRCQSLEIQFANTTATLSEMVRVIDSAYHADHSWGYSFWAPAATWFSLYTKPWSVVASLLAVFSIIGLWGNRIPRLKFHRPTFPRWFRTFTARIIETPTLGTSGQSFLQESRAFVKNLVEPSKTVPGMRKGRLNAAQLVVLRANGRREENYLPENGTFRIGSDPSFPIYFDQQQDSYVEIWIRRARAGYFLEVMFSDEPVYINNKIINETRSLKHGDLIELKDISIIYLEK